MQTVSIDGSGHLSVSLSGRPNFMSLCCAQTTERIDVLLGGDFWGPQRHCISWRVPITHGEEWGGLDAAFAKSLWPLVSYVCSLKHCMSILQQSDYVWLAWRRQLAETGTSTASWPA